VVRDAAPAAAPPPPSAIPLPAPAAAPPARPDLDLPVPIEVGDAEPAPVDDADVLEADSAAAAQVEPELPDLVSPEPEAPDAFAAGAAPFADQPFAQEDASAAPLGFGEVEFAAEAPAAAAHAPPAPPPGAELEMLFGEGPKAAAAVAAGGGYRVRRRSGKVFGPFAEAQVVDMLAKGELLGNEDVEASQPGEVVAHGDWYDYETKYSDGGMELIVPAPLDPEQTTRLRELAVESFRLAGCAGLARCDFFVEPDGQILVNELNTMPGFTETSVYAKLWESTGLPYPALCDRLVNLAIERHAKARSYEY